MSTATILGLAAAALVGLGVFAVIVARDWLRRIVGCNLLAGGVFLFFGVAARRGAGAGLESDPVPLALVITGIVVAFAGTALAVALLVRLAEVSGADGTDDAPHAGGRDRGSAS